MNGSGVDISGQVTIQAVMTVAMGVVIYRMGEEFSN